MPVRQVRRIENGEAVITSKAIEEMAESPGMKLEENLDKIASHKV